MLFKIELLFWGLVTAWVSFSSGATLKTQDYDLHQRQLRSAVTGKTGDLVIDLKEHSFDPRPDTDPDEARNPGTGESAVQPSEKPPSVVHPSSAPMSVSSLPLYGVEIVDGTSIDFVPSVEGDEFMSGRAFHKVYSALDSIAQFMPVELTKPDSQNSSSESLGEKDKNNPHSNTESSSGMKPTVDDTIEIPSSSREAMDSEGTLITLHEEGELNETLPHVETPKETAAVNGSDDEARAIVDISKPGMSGVSYIIHPENLPAPTYKPMENLPPPSHAVAKWRPDIFMKVCCSEPEPEKATDDADDLPASLDVKSGYSQVGTTAPSDEERGVKDDVEVVEMAEDKDEESDESEVVVDDEEIIEGKPYALSLISKANNISLSELFNVTDIILNNETSNPDISSNHTPRYDESGSAYQDVANFLKDIANSEGFKNAFLGDLIKNFGDLDQNAMKLIYSLLIRPLENASKSSVKSDRAGAIPVSNTGQNRLPVKEDFVMLGKDRLPLRDEPANGYNPLGLFPPKNPSRPNGRPQEIRPSSLVRQVSPVTIDKDWHPMRINQRLPSDGRRGDEDIDVITAPPFQTFEVVLGSSLNHDKSKPVPENLPGNRWGAPPPGSPSQNSHGMPFDKLKLGLEMPPPEALDALPPGSVLIPPSQILNQPNLPHIFTNEDGTPSLEIPLSELQGGPQSQRLRPPSKPLMQDIPPRLPSFLSSLFPLSRPKTPQRSPNSGPMLQRPFLPPGPPGTKRPGNPFRQGPTGPPPIVTKMTPPPPRVDYIPEQPPLSMNGHSPSMFTPHSGEETDGSDDHAAPVALDELEVSGHVPVQIYAHNPPEPTSSPTNNPKPVADIHMNYDSAYDHYITQSSTARPPTPGFEIQQSPVGQSADYSSDGDYETEKHSFNQEENNSPQQSDDSYYKDLPVDYIIDYYEYKDYYEDQLRREERPLDEAFESDFDSDKQYEDYRTRITIGENVKESFDAATKESPFTKFDPVTFEDLLMGHQSAADSATLTEQEKNDLQMLLQNHRMANAIAEANGTVFDMSPDINIEDVSLPPSDSENIFHSTLNSGTDNLHDDNHNHKMIPLVPHGEVSQYVPPSLKPESELNEYNEHDASVAHLWNNIQLIPLAPELFDDVPKEEETSMNLTALFNDAVPLSPDLTINEPPDLEFDIDRISIDNSDGHITTSEDLDKNGDAKFMAYILIGACCGLALLSIGGVIVIVRFKKTCGSKQIRTRTRLTEQDSVENISRHVENLAQGGESGHKLGSWFTGRNEHIGSGKLRSNMTLPTVHDLKREKGSKSGSTRDLLSISSESSHASSPRQKHRSGGTTVQNEDEEPRNSWLHDEYRASMSDLSQAPGQDLTYIPRKYQQSRSAHENSQPSSSHNEHQRYRDEPVEQDQAEHPSRERRYTGQSRSEQDCSPNRRRSRFMSSMESEELEERLDRDNRYATDSEVEDWTTHYEDESREPSRYMSDSRELDDTVARRNDPVTVTSQELGDQLSRDLKQYQSRRECHSDQALRNGDHNPQSSQEVDVEDSSRELQRSHSQVSFSRDNVQNEVFLEFDNIFRQHGQYLSGGEAPASTLGRLSRATEDTHFSASRANTPDSIDLPGQHSRDDHLRDNEPPPSPPNTPPRFSPPPAPPRPPKPGHLSQPSTPSPTGNRAKLPSPDQSPPSPPRNQRPVYWTSEEERLI